MTSPQNLLRAALLFALLAALAGYFGPWTWHPAVAFRYSADDLSELVKFMPAVRSGQVSITRELFFLPIWLASMGLALWLGRFVRQRIVRWFVGGGVMYAAAWPMPMYPFILDAYQSPEFAASFWASAIAAALCLAALAFGGRLRDRAASLIWIAMGVVGALVAPLHFVRLKPWLDDVHTWRLDVGWGIGAVVIGFVVVAAVGALMLRKATGFPVAFSFGRATRR